MMSDEDFEAAVAGGFLLGGMFLTVAASMALIGFWGSVLWIGLLFTWVGTRLL